MPKKSKWHRKGRKSNESPAGNTLEVPPGLPEPGTSQNYASVQHPERPRSSTDDRTNSTSATSSSTGGNTNTSISVAPNQASNVAIEAAQQSPLQDEGHSDVHAGRKDYWKLAVEELQKEDPSIEGDLTEVQRAAEKAGNADFSTQLLHTTEQALEALKSKQWTMKAGSRAVVLRDHFNGLVKVLKVFKDVCNAIGNVDPVHAGLPLAGFCLLMQVRSIGSVPGLRWC